MESAMVTDDFDEDQCMDSGDDNENGSEDVEHERKTKAMHAITGRGVTLSMLMQDGLIEPGDNCMTIEYLGRKFTADLLPSGKIRSTEEKQIFGSPSAWAIHCKKIVNPEKKSGCGWASVKYKGKKLDVYKSSWVRKQKPMIASNMSPGASSGKEGQSDTEMKSEKEESMMEPVILPEQPQAPTVMAEPEQDAPLNLCMSNKEEPKETYVGRMSVKHSTLGNRSSEHDPNTLVKCASFQNMGKIQPFNVTLTTNCLLLIDFHCHLITSEVAGYLGGKWDPASQHLIVQQAFPCKCRLGDREKGPIIEDEIRQNMLHRGLSLVGWYHSHPRSQPDPSLRDIESQMEYQLKLKSATNVYLPCIALISSPYKPGSSSKESDLRTFWVMPPPEQKPLLYGMPMTMQYTKYQDLFLTQDILNEMKSLVNFYKDESDLVKMKDIWAHPYTYFDKLKSSLSDKLPKDQGDGRFGEFLKEIIEQS